MGIFNFGGDIREKTRKKYMPFTILVNKHEPELADKSADELKVIVADLKKQEIEIADQEELISALLEMDIDEDMNICQYQVDQSKSVSVSRGAHGYKMEINEY